MMTNEEAIRVLNVAKAECEWNAPLEYQEAFDVAIEALKAQPKHDQNTMSKQQDLETLGIKTGETCEDAISRQAAIDIFDDYNVSVENGDLEAYSRDRKRLCELPSAQPSFPQRHENDHIAEVSKKATQPVITCDGCRFVGTYDTDLPCCSCVRREKDYYEPEK